MAHKDVRNSSELLDGLHMSSSQNPTGQYMLSVHEEYIQICNVKASVKGSTSKLAVPPALVQGLDWFSVHEQVMLLGVEPAAGPAFTSISPSEHGTVWLR